MTADIILIPAPSNDVNDPLNWPKWKKIVAFLTICFYSWVAGWAIGGVTIGIPSIMQDFNVDLNTAINGVISWLVFALGIGVNPFKHIADFLEFPLDTPFSLSWQTSCVSFRRSPFICLLHLVC